MRELRQQRARVAHEHAARAARDERVPVERHRRAARTGGAGSPAGVPSIAIRPLRARRSTERRVPSPASARNRFSRTSAAGSGSGGARTPARGRARASRPLPARSRGRRRGRARALAQRLDLRRRQEPPRARRETPEREAAIGRPVERDDRVADRLDHAPHLAIAALVEDELDGRRRGPDERDLGGRRRAVVEHDAARERRQAARRGHPADRRVVGLLDAVARVHQPVRERTVVRQHERTGRVRVEPPDREHALRDADEPDDGRAPLRVVRRRDDTGGLVQEHVDRSLGLDRPPVHAHDICRRHADAERLDDRAVDRDAPLRDEPSTARREPKPAEARNLLMRASSSATHAGYAGATPCGRRRPRAGARGGRRRRSRRAAAAAAGRRPRARARRRDRTPASCGAGPPRPLVGASRLLDHAAVEHPATAP